MDSEQAGLNTLEVRVSALEFGQTEITRNQQQHARSIARLLTQDNVIRLALNGVSGELKSMREQIALGVKAILYGAKFLASCMAGLIVIIGGFWAYSARLDARYAPKVDSIISSAQAQSSLQKADSGKLAEATETLNDTVEKTASIGDDVKDIQSKRAFKAMR